MGRPKKAAKPAPVEPEEESQEVPEEQEELEATEPEAEGFKLDNAPAPANGSISKAEAVRQALAAGCDKPEDGVAYLRTHFGIEMTKQVFSSNKAQQKSREKKQGDAVEPAPRKRAASPAAAPAEAPKAAVTTGDPGLLNDLAAVKHLVERLGAEQVRQIVGLFE